MSETVEMVEHKELSKQEKQALFIALEKAQGEAATAQKALEHNPQVKALEAANAKVAAATTDLANKLGKGTYSWKGNTYQVVKARGDAGGYTMRHLKAKAQEIG